MIRILNMTIALTAVTLPALAETEGFMRDIRPNHWTWNGADPLAVEAVLDRLRSDGEGRDLVDTAPDGEVAPWTTEFTALGDTMRDRAQAQEALSLEGAAADLYLRASAYYTLAKYPLIERNEAETAAFEASLDTLHRAYELKGYTVERVTAPALGDEASAHLLLPAGDAPEGGWPLVVASNGIDVNQGEFFTFASDLAARGIAMAMFDIAGTGTNHHLVLAANYEEVPVALAETLGARAYLDADRVAVMGVSFGGNAAVKLAHTRPDLVRAAINMCGPLHSAFQVPEDQFENVGLMYRLALFDRTEIDNDPSELLARMREFSLIDQGVVTPGEATTDVPILSVNARGDYVAPEFDMDLANASTTDGTLIYSGADDHCPQDRFTVMPQVIDWIEDKLAVTSEG